MSETEQKEGILRSLQGFDQVGTRDGGLSLLKALGYSSDKRIELKPNSAARFRAEFDSNGILNEQHAITGDWKSVDLLFQLTEEEVRRTWQGNLGFSKGTIDNTAIESYVFFAIELSDERYTRTKLAGITREINKLFPMPVMVLFRHGRYLTIAIINREVHKRDESRDVLRKVTLIKDIELADPLRAHIDILDDLSFSRLVEDFAVHNFVGLHRAWEKRLDAYQLNERFYRDVASWYFWVLKHKGIAFPSGVDKGTKEERDEKQSIFVIRLITRLIFCWFLQEKGLIPRALFRSASLGNILLDFSAKSGSYYNAILQNLFFVTLNQESGKRAFRDKKERGWYDSNRGVTNLFRYQDQIKNETTFLDLLKTPPFVNGGLFDCLDRVYKGGGQANIRLDGFSDNPKESVFLPNEIFFGTERAVDLSDVYEDRSHKSERVRGLIETLSRYKFTVEENTPLEQEVALDPELLGKVFENLLASYNPDTRTTARKATGSFYTPREIVGYMVDEALADYFRGQLDPGGEDSQLGPRLRTVLRASVNEFRNPLNEQQTEALIAAIDNAKVVDPACGSGAFPMGVLQRLVDLLSKFDPNNKRWKEQQKQRAIRDKDLAEKMEDEENRENALHDIEARIEDIERSFNTRFHDLDFARKLYLIENSIYGVDIQPIACQIAKLRFFIALIVDQKVDRAARNSGVRPLPNLETRIVAADALTPIEGVEQHQYVLGADQVRKLRESLELVRHEHFNARTPEKKAKCRTKDAEIRAQLADELERLGMPNQSARMLAGWDPYDQNVHAGFFDPEWMFSIKTGFDVVIGNPPYVRIQTLKQSNPDYVVDLKQAYVSASKGNFDLYVVFVERGLQLLKAQGNVAYILPHKFFNAQYGEPLRKLIARGRNLRHVVHFGNQQVFPGATNYVCLLFLDRAGSDGCRFVRADDLKAWLKNFQGIEGFFPAESITGEEWNFTVGRSAGIFAQLHAVQQKLEDVTSRIFQGIKTSADKIYILEEVRRSKNMVRAYSPQTEREHDLEAALLHPLVKGGDSRAYSLSTTNRLILFPYETTGESGASLISANKLKDRYPATWAYLCANREYLKQREDGAMSGAEWYAYGRSQALDLIGLPKLFTPDLAPTAAFSYDQTGEVFFTGGVAGGYGIIPKPGFGPEFLLGLLNSRTVDFYHHNVATSMRGGWYSYEARFIKNLPIITASDSEQKTIEVIVAYLLWLNRSNPGNGSGKSAGEAPINMSSYFEQLINGLVYELYFQEQMHAAKLFVFKHVAESRPPSLDQLPEASRYAALTGFFEKISGLEHPIRSCLFSLRSLEFVRIIEGEQ
jgi:adenine-specific DNA-methyltransferase